MTQREMFEKWAEDFGLDTTPYSGDSDYYDDGDTGTAWEAWQAACPDGWQAVPVDPPIEVIEVFWGEVWHGDDEMKVAKEAWSDALSFANEIRKEED